MVPRSGCSRISDAGSPAITSIPSTSKDRTPRLDQSARSAHSSAMPTTTVSLANSDGCTDIPPSISHDREPLMVEPMVSTSTSPRIDPR